MFVSLFYTHRGKLKPHNVQINQAPISYNFPSDTVAHTHTSKEQWPGGGSASNGALEVEVGNIIHAVSCEAGAGREVVDFGANTPWMRRAWNLKTTEL